jgi:hypothetical protein
MARLLGGLPSIVCITPQAVFGQDTPQSVIDCIHICGQLLLFASSPKSPKPTIDLFMDKHGL